MQQQQLTAYLNLIQELLTCPQGEEWIRLKHHEDLVDVQFLQVMEQVATQLAQQGNQESAIFLHHWATQLHHILLQEVSPPSPDEDRSEAYLDLIQKLLTSPDGREDDILQAHQALIGPGLVHKMHEVARQFILQGDVKTTQFLEGLAYQLKQQWLQAHAFEAANLQKASVHHPPTSPAIAAHSFLSSAAATGDAQPDRPMPMPSAVDQSPSTPPPIEASDLSDPWNPSTEAPMAATASPAPSNVATTPPQPDGNQAIATGLNAIAAALQQLTQTLSGPQSPHPLWYLEMLEQACTSDWQLTTEEVEQLIGVKPHCHKEETVYERGNWCFTKVGKLGGQTAWQVSKLS
ncbi:MAG: hypothetical protein ACFB0G_10745 [Leptolyngbyaceae cyanobacterium]